MKLLLALALALTACMPKKTEDEPVKKAAEPAKPHVWRMTLPPGHSVEASVLVELLKLLNTKAGFEAVSLPGPLGNTDSEMTWTDGGDGELDTCLGEPIPVPEGSKATVPGMRLRFHLEWVREAFPKRAALDHTEWFEGLVHCVGHALGMTHEEARSYDGVMGRLRSVAGVP